LDIGALGRGSKVDAFPDTILPRCVVHRRQSRNFADSRLVEFMDLIFPEYGSNKTFNSAFIASRRHAITFALMRNLARRGERLAKLFEVGWSEQPF